MLLLSGFSDCSCAECDVDISRPVIKKNVLELANLLLEGYFQALYAPLGGLRTQKEKASFKSTKLYISMFSDKPPCMPLCFGTVDYTARGDQGFFLFLSLCSSNFFPFLNSTVAAFSSSFSSCLAFFLLFFFLQFLFSFFYFFFFLRLSFQPEWVM